MRYGWLKLTLSTAMLLGLSACASTPPSITAEVTRFHQDIAPSGRTVYIQPNAQQKQSLEFQQYAGLIRQHLQAHGYSPVTRLADADYTLGFDYTVDNGSNIVRSQPIFGRPYGHYSRRGWPHPYRSSVGIGVGFGGYDPYGEVEVIGTNLRSDIIYHRTLTLNITRKRDGQKLFEGTAISRGTAPQFSEVSACIIKAMFEGFPGASGSTVTVRLPSNQCTP
jgi:hypothetical protein